MRRLENPGLQQSSETEHFAQIRQPKHSRIGFEEIEEASCLKLASHAFVSIA